MQNKLALNFIAAFAAIGTFATQSAHAYIIDFDSEGFTGPSLAADTAAGNISVPTPIGLVSFSGGAILTNEANLPADSSSVYYTSFFLSGGTNPITITFPQDINNFFLDVYNGETSSDDFTVSDNLGNTNTVMLPNNTAGGTAMISFPAAGNIVTVSATNTAEFDFSIDNIGFDQPTPTVPEPTSMALLSAGLFGLSFIRRRYK